MIPAGRTARDARRMIASGSTKGTSATVSVAAALGARAPPVFAGRRV
jgi:hypothetical protein